MFRPYFETLTDLILQDYHNQKMFGPPWSLVYLTATFYPPIGQMMTFKYDSINTTEPPSIDSSLIPPDDSDLITDNHDDHVNLVLGDWRPAVSAAWQPTIQLAIEPLITPTILSTNATEPTTISV